MDLAATLHEALIFAAAGGLLALVMMRWKPERPDPGLIPMLSILAIAVAGVATLARFGASLEGTKAGIALREGLLVIATIGFIRILLVFIFQGALARLTLPRILSDVLFLSLIVWAIYRMDVLGVDLAGIVTTSAILGTGVALSLREPLTRPVGRAGVAARRTPTASATGFASTMRWPGCRRTPALYGARDRRRRNADHPEFRPDQESRARAGAARRSAHPLAAARRDQRRLRMAAEPRDQRHRGGARPRRHAERGARAGAVVHLRRFRDQFDQVHRPVLADRSQPGPVDRFGRPAARIRGPAARRHGRADHPRRDLESGQRRPCRRGGARARYADRAIGFSGIVPAVDRSRAQGAVGGAQAGAVRYRRCRDARRRARRSRCTFSPAARLASFAMRRSRPNRRDSGSPLCRRPRVLRRNGTPHPGQARTATVVAEGEVLCYRLDKPGFEAILKARPEMAVGLSQTLAARQAANDATLASLSAEARARATRLARFDLVQKTRAFFGM